MVCVKITHLKTDNNWNAQFEFFSGSNDTLSDDVTSHDPAKNVDQDGVHLGRKDDFNNHRLMFYILRLRLNLTRVKSLYFCSNSIC